jgi:hypothetical protein
LFAYNMSGQGHCLNYTRMICTPCAVLRTSLCTACR